MSLKPSSISDLLGGKRTVCQVRVQLQRKRKLFNHQMVTEQTGRWSNFSNRLTKMDVEQPYNKAKACLCVCYWPNTSVLTLPLWHPDFKTKVLIYRKRPAASSSTKLESESQRQAREEKNKRPRQALTTSLFGILLDQTSKGRNTAFPRMPSTNIPKEDHWDRKDTVGFCCHKSGGCCLNKTPFLTNPFRSFSQVKAILDCFLLATWKRTLGKQDITSAVKKKPSMNTDGVDYRLMNLSTPYSDWEKVNKRKGAGERKLEENKYQWLLWAPQMKSFLPSLNRCWLSGLFCIKHTWNNYCRWF